jgi:lysophospholipase L1-like esterase
MTPTPSPSVPPASPTGRPFVARGLIFALMLGLLAIEWSLRSYTSYGATVEREADPALGWRLRTADLAYGESGIPLRINSHGFRDQEWLPADSGQESILRIAVLGNSVTFGAGVEESERWTDLLEESIRAETPQRAIVVMNFGLPGYTLEQMAQCYEHAVRPHKPDLVLLALNDVSARPVSVWEPEHASALAQAVRETALYDFWQRSVSAGDHAQGRRYNPSERAEHRRVQAIWEEPFAPAHEVLWRRFIRRTAELAGEVHSDGSQLVLIPLPAFVHCRHPDRPRLAALLADWDPIHELDRLDTFPAARKVMDPLLKHVAEMGLDPDRIWSTDRESMDQIDPQWADQSLFFLHDPKHFTPRGHAMLADEIHEGLREQGFFGF